MTLEQFLFSCNITQEYLIEFLLEYFFNETIIHEEVIFYQEESILDKDKLPVYVNDFQKLHTILEKNKIYFYDNDNILEFLYVSSTYTYHGKFYISFSIVQNKYHLFVERFEYSNIYNLLNRGVEGMHKRYTFDEIFEIINDRKMYSLLIESKYKEIP